MRRRTPHIDVEYEIRYEDEVYEDMLGKLAARGELGDVIQLKEPCAYAESGLIAPLPPGLAGQVATRCTVGDESYAVAALGITTGIVYNKALFAQYGLDIPASYDEFLALCEALKSRGITPLGVSGKDLWHLEFWLNHFYRADVLGAEPDFAALCADGERDWSDPLITTMLTHYAELFRLGYVDEGWTTTPDGALPYQMAEGKVAMVFSGSWLAEEIRLLAPAMELGWFYPPGAEGAVMAGSNEDVFWAVTAGCAADDDRYAAAAAFLEFFYAEGVYEPML